MSVQQTNLKPNPLSWQSSSYQQAIWKARRRLRGKQDGNISDAELQVMKEFLQPLSKPDYSRWVNADEVPSSGLKFPKLAPVINSQNEKPSFATSPRQDDKSMKQKSNAIGIGAEYDVVIVSVVDLKESKRSGFVAISDQAPIHEHQLPTFSAVDISTSYDNFGLCTACFHRKGPHHHYQAPIRVGGGYSIYRHQTLDHASLSWNTLKWLSDVNRPDVDPAKESAAGVQLGDEYCNNLYKEFVAKGGDTEALQEYLESNFSPEVLEDLESAGVNVNLILEYTELYRRHVKKLLQSNIEQQSKLMKKYGDGVDFATLYSEIENEGVNMKMLVIALTKGRNNEAVIEFERKGGDTEILEHYCDEIEKSGRRDEIAKCFVAIVESESRHRSAEAFLEYIQAGGHLDDLKERAENKPEHHVGDENMSSLEKCLSRFDELSVLSRELDGFLNDYGHLYICAFLLQEYIEKGGRVANLKNFVKSSSNESGRSWDDYTEFALLKEIGDEFVKDAALRRGLEHFPEEPSLIEAYLRRGGNFPALVREMADVIEIPKFENYVKTTMNEVLEKASEGKHPVIAVDVAANPSTLRDISSPAQLAQSSSLPSVYVLSRILEKAKADLMYSEFKEAEESWKNNEGKYLVKTMKRQGAVSEQVSSVDATERNMITRIYMNQHSPSRVSSVSTITGKQRDRLWVAPKPFEIKRSSTTSTKPQTPFSRNRDIRISSLTEDHILGVEKKQRDELDLMRRTLKIGDFQKKWHLEITSPCGSIVAASSQNPENLLVATQQPVKLPVKAPVKKDRKSRRQQQREKMKALRHDIGRSGRESPAISARSSVSSLLSLPQLDMSGELRPIPDVTVTREERREPADDARQETNLLKVVTSNATDARDEESDSKRKTMTATLEEAEKELIRKPITLYATAFGPKLSSASFSNMASTRELLTLRDDPETLIATLSAKHKVLSKSDSNMTSVYKNMEKKVPASRTTDDLTEKISAKKRQHTFDASAIKTSEAEDAQSSSEDAESEEDDDMIDILKQYCIIREDRLPFYKRIFDKYVIIKSLRDREHSLSQKKAKHREQQEGTAFDEHFFATEGTTKFELGKTRFLIEKLKENLEEVQTQIAAVKGEVNSTIARVARRKFHDIIASAKERRDRLNSVRNRAVFRSKQDAPAADDVTGEVMTRHDVSNPLPVIRRNDATEQGDFTDNEVLRLLTPRMRRQCEAQVEVRDRKVTLVYLRDKAKRLLTRQRTLAETCTRLIKQIDKEDVEKGIRRKKLEHFTRKQSTMFQTLHPTEDSAIDECDLRNALADLDPALKFVDNLQFLDGISDVEGITLRVFCVMAALHEKKQSLRFYDAKSLDAKMKTCREHYARLLGPNLDVVQVDLAAAGISPRQQEWIVQKLTRDNTGRLDFIDFVTYVPFFIDIHQKILTNPLPA